MDTVCVIGLGIIGSIWANHYAADGKNVRCWNRTPKADLPGFLPDITEAASGADIVHICVADPPAVQLVLNPILPVLKPGVLVIQSSTISPVAAESFERQVTETGAAYVEAPFTGSKPAAESRQLVFFLGGESVPLERAVEVLSPLSRKQFHFETPQQATAIKLAMNLQIAAISQALTEGWHLARNHGLNADQFFDVLKMNAAHSPLADLKEPKLRSGDEAPQFSVKHMAKDLGLALASAGDLHLQQAERTREIYQMGIESGLGDLDFIALERLVKAQA